MKAMLVFWSIALTAIAVPVPASAGPCDVNHELLCVSTYPDDELVCVWSKAGADDTVCIDGRTQCVYTNHGSACNPLN